MLPASLNEALAQACKTGALVGLLHTVMAAFVWRLHEYPDFYFRSGLDGLAALPLILVAAVFASLPYGFILWLGAKTIRRHLNWRLHISATLVVAPIASYFFVQSAFDSRRIDNPAIEFYTILVIVGLGTLLTSRPMKGQNQALQPSSGG